MDPLVLSRLQFAVTTVYHFFFVPLTLGEVAMCIVAGALSIAAFEIVKMSRMWKHHETVI